MADYNDNLSDKELQKKRNDANNAKNIRNAADVAVASGEAHAVAIGEGVKIADKLTDGKSTELLGKSLSNVNKFSPAGGKIQDLSNKLSESGASDKIGRAASMYNGMNGGLDSGNKGSEIVSNIGGGQQNVPLPSSDLGNASAIGETGDSKDGDSKPKIAGVSSTPKHSFLDDDEEKKDDKEKNTALGNLRISLPVKIALFAIFPIVVILILILVIVAMLIGVFSDYDDMIGISQTIGEETGEVYFTSSNPDQQAFFDRVKNVKLKEQAAGRTVDPLKVVAVYHILNENGANLEYSDMSEWKIMDIVDAMFDGNSYSKENFKKNLVNTVIPKYISNTSKSQREKIADDVFDYIDRYNDLIGKNNKKSSSCGSAGNCSYDIKGFYINGRGNVAKSMQISNLKVRLMECGGRFGNGDYNKPIDQPLVDFEDYVAGVAYAEIGADSPPEAVKAQLIAARSFALARPTEMGNALGKKLEEENGQWVLQIASCVSDQVFCNINEGCSYMGGGDGQGGIVRSGKIAGAWRTRDALAADHPLRSYMKETEGEVLVNDQGYIIETGFDSSDQYSFIDLAKQGLNYKQILLQFYNSGRRPYHAADIQKTSCSGGGSKNCGVSSGEFASWKQYGAPWSGVAMGGSNIGSVGCLVTSISIQIAKSGVPTILDDFNPGTFVAYLNSHGAFGGGGGLSSWASPSWVAPTFQFSDNVSIAGMSREQKLQTISNILNEGKYPVCEVKGGHGQHWVAIDSVNGDTVNMMDPGSQSTDLWAQYPWSWTSRCIVYKVTE